MIWALPRLSRYGWALAVGLSAIGATAVAVVAPRSILGLVAMAAAVFAGPLVVIDVRYHLLPNVLVVPLGAINAGLTLWACAAQHSWVPARDAGVSLAGVAALIALVMWARSASVGMGDLKLLGALALGVGAAGPVFFLAAVMVGIVLAGLWALVLVLARRVHRHRHIAMGPWLMSGTMATSPMWTLAEASLPLV